MEVIHQKFKFLCKPCSTDLGMLGQIIHYRKMGRNLIQQTGNTDIPTFRDQMCVRAKLIFTHITQDGVY